MILRIAAVVSLSIAVSVSCTGPAGRPSAISIPGDQKSAPQDRWKAIRCIPSRFLQRGRSASTGVAAFDTVANATAGRSISSRSINPRLEFRVTPSNTQDLQNSSGTPSYAKALYIGVSGESHNGRRPDQLRHQWQRRESRHLQSGAGRTVEHPGPPRVVN